MLKLNANIFVIIECIVVWIASINDLCECTLDASASRDTIHEQQQQQPAGHILVLANMEKEIPTSKRIDAIPPIPSGLFANLTFFVFFHLLVWRSTSRRQLHMFTKIIKSTIVLHIQIFETLMFTIPIRTQRIIPCPYVMHMHVELCRPERQ